MHLNGLSGWRVWGNKLAVALPFITGGSGGNRDGWDGERSEVGG